MTIIVCLAVCISCHNIPQNHLLELFATQIHRMTKYWLFYQIKVFIHELGQVLHDFAHVHVLLMLHVQSVNEAVSEILYCHSQGWVSTSSVNTGLLLQNIYRYISTWTLYYNEVATGQLWSQYLECMDWTEHTLHRSEDVYSKNYLCV